MNLKYYLVFTILAVSLIAWQLWRDDKKKNILYGVFTWLAVAGYSYMIWLSDLSLFSKGIYLFKDFLLLSVISFVAGLLGHTKLLRIPLFAGSIFLLLFINKMVHPFIPNLSFSTAASSEILIKIKPGAKADFENFADSKNIKYQTAFQLNDVTQSSLDDYYILDIDGNEMEKSLLYATLENRPEVDFIEINDLVYIPNQIESNEIMIHKGILPFNDPMIQDQWGLHEILDDGFFNTIKKIKTNEKPLLAILDSGVDSKHEDIAEYYKSIDKKSDKDMNGHGTHCAGIAAAVPNNGIGVSSMNINHIYDVTSVRVLNAAGMGTQQGIINGILKAVDAGADVISMSLGGPSNDRRQKSYNEAIEYARRRGAIVVVAAGNSNLPAKNYSPANSKGALCVYAVGENLKKAPFSNTIEDIEFAIGAPGVNIMSTMPNNQYKSLSGTSMATPLVSSLVAIMKAYDSSLQVEDIHQLLYKHSIMSSQQFMINPGGVLDEMINR